MIRIHCLAFAAAVLVTGCAPIHQPKGFLGKLWRLEVGPRYERPAVDTPADLQAAVARIDHQLVAVVNLHKGPGGGWQLPGEQVTER